MKSGLTFYLTKHFRIRLAERFLNADDVKAVIHSSSERRFLKIGVHGGKLSRYRKTAGGRTLLAVAEIKGGKCWIVTAYYEN